MIAVPEPVGCSVSIHAAGDGAVASMIVRLWQPESAASCRLCPRCNARRVGVHSACLVVVPGFLGDEEARMHRFDEASGDALPEPDG